jgi:hypothetical protein
MTNRLNPVTIALRIPGKWSHPREMIERMPKGCRFAPESLVLSDGTQVGIGALDADDQFAQIFRSSCRQPAAVKELAIVDSFTVNVVLTGPGGSLQSAHAMMMAAAAIIRAGGAGVFIDNSALAHGGQNWLTMTDDGSPDAISFAFVNIVASETDVWTMGMHVLGLRDVIMKRVDADRFSIVEVIRYLARSEEPINNGHLIADPSGPQFQAFTQDSPEGPVDSPLQNPFGRLKLVNLREVAESN